MESILDGSNGICPQAGMVLGCLSGTEKTADCRGAGVSRQIEFSVIIPVCHGGKFLKEVLTSLAGIDYSQGLFEVIVAGSDDDEESRNMVRSLSAERGLNVRYIGCFCSNRSKRLNTACAAAKGKVFAFTDDDCILPMDWLKKLSSVFERGDDIGIMGGMDELAGALTAFDISLDRTLHSFIGAGAVRSNKFFAGRFYPKLWNMALTREVAFKTALNFEGGRPHIFNEALDIHEDVELSDRIERLGGTIVSVPELRVLHYRDTTLRSFVINNFIMARTCRTIGIHRLAHTISSALVIFLSASVVLSFFLLPFRLLVLGALALYFLLLTGVALSAFFKTRKLLVLVLVPVLISSLHIARGTGYLFPLHGVH